jgi:hypothetical protein
VLYASVLGPIWEKAKAGVGKAPNEINDNQ